ncbi:hypothetical protein JTB14_022180 [Gonioctena quinquepunctata]|nr:hypothetical protein JTB14_022180 [Gonioctena quinquepunctata]
MQLLRFQFVIHGETRRRLTTIQKSLQLNEAAPTDGRGKHTSKFRKLSEQSEREVCTHIASFKGRTSHYSKKKTNKLYLPEELNVIKMYNLYKEKYSRRPVSFESYRTIFTTQFNIAFGFPRCDSSCDEFNATLKVLGSKLSETLTVQETDKINSEIRSKTKCIKKGETFYVRKRTSRYHSMKNVDAEAVCMDFQKNLPLPKITTNDVYYKRQLSFYSFNIHRLSDADSVFNTYTEEMAKKGANEVIFPIRGHSYTRTELPEDWVETFRSAQQKPFKVEEVDQSMVGNWSEFLEPVPKDSIFVKTNKRIRSEKGVS